MLLKFEEDNGSLLLKFKEDTGDEEQQQLPVRSSSSFRGDEEQ